MKKALALFLILSVCIVSVIGNAMADDFTLRNGLKFGMTVSEVKEIEKNNGISSWSTDLENTLQEYASVAGYNHTLIVHDFNQSDDGVYRLREVFYHIGDMGQDVFDSLSESLIAKYGSPQHSYYTDKYIFPIHSKAMARAIIYKTDRTSGPYYEWLLDYNDYYVLVDITLFADSETYGFPLKVAVSYKQITEEDIQAYNNSVQETENKIENERNRDL